MGTAQSASGGRNGIICLVFIEKPKKESKSWKHFISSFVGTPKLNVTSLDGVWNLRVSPLDTTRRCAQACIVAAVSFVLLMTVDARWSTDDLRGIQSRGSLPGHG